MDRAIDERFEPLRGTPILDRVFYTASALGEFGAIWVLLGLLRSLRGSESDRRAGRRTVVGSVIESLTVNIGIKSLFLRRRPVQARHHPYRLREPRTSSFPSGHATAAFCAATLLSEDDPLAPAYYTLAAVVAASRVYVQIHHASDVIGGIAIGIALGRLGRALAPLPRPGEPTDRELPRPPLTSLHRPG
jgi:undecaprenyl-diphosphatase